MKARQKMIDLQLEMLGRPFEAKDIEWRIQQSGDKNGKIWAMCLAYVTNRAIMDRLDEVFGLGGWKNEFKPTPSMQGTMCGLSVKVDGEWVTKWDGADNTDIEATTGGLSSSMKRAGVQLRIGRYLYHLEAGWANIVEGNQKGAKSAKTKSGTWFKWTPPELPNFALPITTTQLKEIVKLHEIKDSDESKMLEYFKLSDITNATKEDGANMIVMLSKKKDKEKKDA